MTDSVSDRLRRSAQNEQTSIDLNRLLKQERAEKERLRDTLAHIESQILYRDESMPDEALAWRKTSNGFCRWIAKMAYFDEWHMGYKAPDYRPDEDGPITLAIIDPPVHGRVEEKSRYDRFLLTERNNVLPVLIEAGLIEVGIVLLIVVGMWMSLGG